MPIKFLNLTDGCTISDPYSVIGNFSRVVAQLNADQKTSIPAGVITITLTFKEVDSAITKTFGSHSRTDMAFLGRIG